MRRYRLLFGCALLAALGCSAGQVQSLSGGASQWPPYSYQDDAGQAQGIAVEIMRQAAAQSGQQVDFVFYPATRLNRLLDEGRLDLNYADSPQWNSLEATEQFVYSQPYLQVREYLYFLDNHPARHLPLEQLRGLRIGVVRGYTYHRLTAALNSGRLSTLETSRERALLDLLMLGRVDAIALVDDVFGDQLAARGLDPDRFARGAKLSDAPLVIKLQRQHADQLPALNAALQALVQSGEVERIRRSHLRTPAIQPGRATAER
ncbi:substrate-binding periplasmic protein [Phytopseudomonas punonensis]|uniref:Amino acid ABC transporter substrate-binding protein, PAAT family n=1 Tax=Phytopseudomonas punonensis TaxID=1220495 RepID=A0A1M7GC41_9GAMM|nr:transporter substrate-binding domain-containing protein [Pseudomonas punonensis]SHM13685.1 amino acid ABC transporter substrate-binding protein, PAAT family [Pseudomonas punonensis]